VTAERSPDDLLRLVEPMLGAAGRGTPRGLFRLPGGGNNRVFRVETDAGPVLLKEYFQHPADPRDRLTAEVAFSRFAWSQGLRMLPEPLASDPLRRLAVYEFIQGRRLSPGEVSADHVRQAGEFLRALEGRRAAAETASLPAAAEACFSIADHCGCVSRRLDRLQAIGPDSPWHREALNLVQQRLQPLWQDLERRATSAGTLAGLRVDAVIPPEERWISPSDFGFHNALLGADGRLRFFDFEYAGWDDPAKTVCDFFCQPAVPVPRAHLDGFLAAATDAAGRAERLRQRAEILLPVYELKWCCIMLNEFLPLGDSRRAFAGAGDSPEARRADQLRKVAAALDRLGS
jgi:hypothetical protein